MGNRQIPDAGHVARAPAQAPPEGAAGAFLLRQKDPRPAQRGMRGFREVLGSWARAFLVGVARGYRGRDFARTLDQLRWRSLVFEIDGAGAFRLLPDRVLRRDVQELLISTGADKAFMEAITAARNPEEPVFEAMYASGRLFELLGRCLTPEGSEWTPRLGRETAEKLERVNSPAGRQTVRRLAIAIFNLSSWAQLQERRQESSDGS